MIGLSSYWTLAVNESFGLPEATKAAGAYSRILGFESAHRAVVLMAGHRPPEPRDVFLMVVACSALLLGGFGGDRASGMADLADSGNINDRRTDDQPGSR